MVNKADFVHNLIHEGFHATVSGRYNTATQSGGRGASLEEEEEGFRVGNAAARALGLPEDTTAPGANYGGGSNPAYPIQFPELVPGQEAKDPTRAPAAAPKQTSALPSQQPDTRPGFCQGQGSTFRCEGVPQYALACEPARLAAGACTIEGTGLKAPCSLGEVGWTCAAPPPAVARCDGGSCALGGAGESCAPEGRATRCTALPAFGLACDPSGACALGDPDPEYGGGGLETAASFLYAATQSADCSAAGPGGLVALRGMGAAGAAGDGDLAQAVTRAFAREAAAAPGLPKARYGFLFVDPAVEALARRWPGQLGDASDPGSDAPAVRGTIDVSAVATGLFAYRGHEYHLRGDRFGSLAVPYWVNGQAPSLDPFVAGRLRTGGGAFSGLVFPQHAETAVLVALREARYGSGAPNPCRRVLVPTDPHYRRDARNGGNSWGAKLDDQWAIKRVGYTDDESSAWRLVPQGAAPVVVAVIDTGLDWHHADLDPASLWRNEDEIPDNGIDDDRNGYVDDVIGWNFVAGDNRPWDRDGHGTFVAGIIAAAHNERGIAGISPNARIMVLKAASDFGTTRASWLAEAIVYAADNGARIINLSVGGPNESAMEGAALAHARSRGVLVVAAAGNDGVELGEFGPAGQDGVLTVGAAEEDGRAAAFSNFGAKVDLVAPGVDVLSLRARGTDANLRPWQGDEYEPGSYVVGADKRYLRASGTSFSTPIVAATAALALGRNPRLTAAELAEILTATAADTEAPGRDPRVGHGLLDARAALAADPGFGVVADITRVELLPAGQPAYVGVWGTIDATRFKRAWLQAGPGEDPKAWRFVGQKRKQPIIDGQLATIPLTEFSSPGPWLVVVNVEDKSGVVKRAAHLVQIP